MVLPWKVVPEDIADLAEYYPGEEVNGRTTILAFYYSGFEVPSLAIFSFYIFLVSLVAINAAKKTLKLLIPDFYATQRARLRWLRSHLLSATLIGRKHSEPYYLFGRRWLPVRAPLRIQFFIILALFLFNLIVLTTFYDITPDDVNVYWPGPTSHRTQQVRYLADRSCVMAMGQLPIVFLTAGRYSPLALVSGINFADSMLYHRWLARMVWLQVSVHSFAYTYLEASSGDLAESFHEAYWNWGVAATSMFWGLTILAYGQLRTKAYEVFVALHVIMGVIVLVGIYFHIHLLDYWRYKVFIVLTEISAAVWAFDRVFRAANRIYISFRLRTTGSIATATLTTHADDLVRLRIRLPLSRLHLPGEQASSSSVLTRIAPGHSVRILVPRLQFFSDHPFTVIGTGRLPEAGDDIGFLDLLIRQQKGFTRHLSKLQIVDAGAVDVESGTIVKQSAVMVEGPSGEIHHDALRGASQVLLFSGGVGIAYTLPYLIETALSHPDVPCTLVWMIRDIALFHAVLVELNAAAKELAARSKAEQVASKIRRAPLLISLHITSRQAAMQEASDAVSELEKHPAATAPTSGEEDKDARSVSVDSSEEGKGATIHVESSCDHLKPYFHITTSYGRADPSSIITPPVAREQEQKQGQGQERGQLVVMSCGPTALCDDVRYETQRALASGAWRDVCYFEECFNW